MSDELRPCPTAIWECKIGVRVPVALPSGCDWPMRKAVEKAFRDITGMDSEFCFSGWSAELTEPELAVVENRQPSEAHYTKWLAARATPAPAAKRPWCETCGVDVAEVVCPRCAKWWSDNPPPVASDDLVGELARAICEADCGRITENELARCADIARAILPIIDRERQAERQAGWNAAIVSAAEVGGTIESPFDEHRDAPEDCAFTTAIDMFETAILALKDRASD